MKSMLLKALLSAAIVGAAIPASAAVITFDEFARDNFAQGAMQANRYAFLGATFATTDDGSSWDGTGSGDPGNWGISGTNGDAFSGYNGSSYNATISFASAVSNLTLDVSRSSGSQAGDTFTLDSYLGSTLLSSQTVVLGAINSWSTVAAAGSVDSIVLSGNGSGFHPFGVDNIRWDVQAPVPEPETYALMLLGLGVVAAIARRRKA